MNLEMVVIPSNSSSTHLPCHRSHALWSNMIRRTLDERYRSHGNFLDAHPSITTKMRSVLCDWLIEVDIPFKRFWKREILLLGL